MFRPPFLGTHFIIPLFYKALEHSVQKLIRFLQEHLKQFRENSFVLSCQDDIFTSVYNK